MGRRELSAFPPFASVQPIRAQLDLLSVHKLGIERDVRLEQLGDRATSLGLGRQSFKGRLIGARYLAFSVKWIEVIA